jgi:branched-chain amino acid transport system substrate-binding protein
MVTYTSAYPRHRRSGQLSGDAGTVIRVGAVLSLSGPFAAQGVAAARGLTLWAEDVNAGGGFAVADRGGRWHVALTFRDDAGRSRDAAAGAEQLLSEERVDLLMGPYSSVLLLAVAPIAERHGRVLWNHGGASDEVSRRGFRYVVNIASPASRYFVGLLEMTRACDPSARRVALLHRPRGTFAPAVAAGAAAHARRAGLDVVLEAPYPTSPAEFAPLVGRVAGARADVVLGAGRTDDDLHLAGQLRARPMGARVLGLVAAAVGLFRDALGEAAEGFFGPSQWEPSAGHRPDAGPTAAEFAARFQRRFGAEPEYPAAQAYAAGVVAERCAAAAGSLRDELLRDAARGLSFATLYGAFALDPGTGEQVGHDLVVVQWQHGAKPVVWPPGVADAPPRLG